jgi:hypothetical protein
MVPVERGIRAHKDEKQGGVINRENWNADCVRREVGHHVVVIAIVVYALDPTWIDGACPGHRREDDQQTYEE